MAVSSRHTKSQLLTSSLVHSQLLGFRSWYRARLPTQSTVLGGVHLTRQILHNHELISKVTMLSLNPKSLPVTPPTRHYSPMEAGRQRQTKLWSNLKELCDLLRIAATVSANNEGIQFQHIQFKSGQRVYTIGQAFEHLYVVNSGFLKTVLIDELGNEQVLSFPMRGDMFGIDGINTRHYASEAVALSDCDIVFLSFKKLTGLAQVHPELENLMYDVLSRELVREQAMIGMLGGLSAEARVARFLVALAQRFAAMGYSSKLFNLRMTRQEIGSYLGLTLETISRTLSAFNDIGLITVDQRAIGIKDAEALQTLRRLPPRARANKRSAEKLSERANLPRSAMPVMDGMDD
jgi:CRP/FNR family transcriptional regulator